MEVPKGVKNSYLRGVKVLPGNATTKKKSLKGEVISAGILHQHYQWQARDEEKKMVTSDFHLSAKEGDMQKAKRREKKKKVLGLVVAGKMKKKRSEREYLKGFKWVVGPTSPKASSGWN